MNSYETHPYLHHCPVAVGSDDAHGLRLRDGDFVVAVFTLANTVSGRATELAWFQGLLGHVSAQGATPHVFVDAALSGCVMSREVLDLRADAPPDGVAALLSSAFGLVQSSFKDFGLSSLLFVDDAPLECCAERAAETGLAVTVAGGAHPLIKHAPVTSIPESPTLGFLLFAREYTAFRRRCFNTFAQRLESAIPEEVEYQLRPLFPLLHVEFASEELRRGSPPPSSRRTRSSRSTPSPMCCASGQPRPTTTSLTPSPISSRAGIARARATATGTSEQGHRSRCHHHHCILP